MAILNLSGTINSSFGASGSLVNALQGSGSAIFTIDLRPTTPKVIVQDNLDYGVLGWDINDVVATIILNGPHGNIYLNTDFDEPDIVPADSRYLNKTITLPLDPQANNENIVRGNYTLKVTWYNSVLDEYENFQLTYHYDLVPPTIANTTTSGPYSGILTSTDTTEYENNGNLVHQVIREHRIQYPTQISPTPPDDIVSSNAQIQVTPIYTNEWSISISSFVEYRNSDTLRIYWEGAGSFTHCVFGGCIGAMWDAINTMLDLYKDALACNVGTQEELQKRLVIVNTAWHLLNDAYWSGDTEAADEQAYTIQEQVESTYGGVCGSTLSTEVVPCPPWTGGGVGGTYTFSNGLVEAAGNVTWGGSLEQDTTILMAGHQVLFSGSDGGSSVSQTISAAGGIIQTHNDGTNEGGITVNATGISLDHVDIGTPADSRSYNVNAQGLTEAADYSAGYGPLSLVNKTYADNLLSGVTTYTFESGINEAAGVVKWGGDLTSPAIVLSQSADGNYIRLGNTDSVNDRSAIFELTTGYLLQRSYVNQDYNGTAGYSSIQQANETIILGSYTGANVHSYIVIGNSAMTVDDDINNKGLVYAADYSAQWTDHSLVTKKWVEDNFATGGSSTFIGNSDTPISYTGFANYFLQVNPAEDGVQFVSGAWVPVTGGSFTGTVTFSTAGSRQIISKTTSVGGNPGNVQAGTNLISFQDGDGDEQGTVGIDGSGNVSLRSNVVGGVVMAENSISVSGDITATGGATIQGLSLDESQVYVVGYNSTSGVLSYKTVSDLNTYTNATPMPEEVGGLPAGTTFTDRTQTNMWDDLLYPYQYPAFSSFVMGGQATTLECGIEVVHEVKTFTWGTTNPSNINSNTIEIWDWTDGIQLGSLLADDGSEALDIVKETTKTVTNSLHQWRIQATNSKSQLFTRYFNVRWYSPFYYGAGAVGLTVAQIQALTKAVVGPGDKSFAFTPSGEVQYIAYPESYGDLTSILDANGFETINDWTLTVESFTLNAPDYNGDTVSYNVYEFDNLTSLGQTYQFIF